MTESQSKRWMHIHGRLFKGDPDLRRFLARANNKYWPWEKLRHESLPPGLTDTEAWRLVRVHRRNASSELPFTDTSRGPFSYWLPASAQPLLHEIDHRVGPGNRRLSDPERRAARALVEEAASSSVLEGAATTIAEAKAFLAQKRKPRTNAERMVANNYRAMQHVKEACKERLTKALLNELHAIITEGTLDKPEQARRFQVPDEKRVSVVDARYGEVVHQPPPAEEIDQRVDAACRFANAEESDDDEAFVHPVVRAIMLHFAIAYIHPWADGNGRTARAVFYWSMLRRGYSIVEFLPISRIIHGHPIQYSQAFQHVEVDGSDATYFILYHLRIIDRALREFDEHVARERERISLQTDILRRFPDLNSRQHMLLVHALDHPNERYTFRGHAARHGVVYQTARTDLLGLVHAGLMDMWGGRPRHFVPVRDLRERLGVAD